MAPIRISRTTPCVLAVFLLVAIVPLRAAEPEDDLAAERALRRVLRTSLPLADRLEAAASVLADPQGVDGESLVRGGLGLLREAPPTGTWLLLAGVERSWLGDDLRARGADDVAALLAGEAPDADRAVWAAAGLLLGHRPDGLERVLASAWPPDPATVAVLRREGIDAEATNAQGLAAEVARRAPASRALDRATSADEHEMRAGLDALRALGEAALPVLLAEVEPAPRGVPEGRLPRTTRAILALGLMGRREATAPLMACLLESPDGWVKVAAATALGDLGDPTAVIALCHQLLYRGDVLRPRDQWDYPGQRETTVAAADWAGIEYFVVDGAAADALLRIGVPGAVEWIVHNQLNPGKANFRVRVLQDAVDALRRAVPAAPVAAYNPDSGFPQRRRAFDALLAWWEAHRFEDATLLARHLDENDPGFRAEARRMVERLRGRSVMELQISQETCALVGPAVTPTLLETLAVANNRVLRTEIARALGAVRDLRAVPPLLELARDRASFLRAVALGSLGAYVERDPRVLPALLAALDDGDPAPRVAALKALVAAPPSDEVRGALARHDPEMHRQTFGSPDRDYEMAFTVASLVQEGEAVWPRIRDGLGHPERYVRRTWWDLLRAALDLPDHLYDAGKDPSASDWKPIDETRVLEALRARRSP